jgi:protein-tyrosine phosphatase
VRRLTAAGWEDARRHGVRRLVDLRFDTEATELDPPPDGIDVVAVSVFGTYDPALAQAFDEQVRSTDDVAAVLAAAYIRALENGQERVAAAVAAVAEADPDGAVVIHCFAGKDRTGIVSALLLSAVGVPDEIVAADYAASAAGVEALSQPWFAEAETEDELVFRRRISTAPEAAMTAVLEWLRKTHGGAEGYLREAGLGDAEVAAVRRRLLG